MTERISCIHPPRAGVAETVADRRSARPRPLPAVRLATFLLAAMLIAACDLLPMGSSLECGTVDPATCRRIADRVLAQKLPERPGHQVKTLRITDDKGSYDIIWDDGNGESMIVD